MRGVKFGDFHTSDDWGLILNAKSIDPPTPKYNKISVDGRDGEINLSRALTGDIKFTNRPVNFTFLLTNGTQVEREEIINEIINIIHGQELEIIEPDDQDHYLKGECTVSNVVNNKAYASFNVSADCEPYRYALDEIHRLVNLSSTETIVTITNSGRKVLVPTLTVSGTAKIVVGSTSVSLASGTYKLTDLQLKSGPNPITVSGSGTITISYREGVI